MRIGPHTLASPVLLAPMAGVCDRPMRQLARRVGAGLAVAEMVSADRCLWASQTSARRLDQTGEIGPRVVQILGAEPVVMAAAARLAAGGGAQIIDVNMGCPARKVCSAQAGSALLRDEALVGRILDAVVRAVDVPVTLKIRTGWDPAHRNALEVARIAEQAGVAALTIHGRTRACGFSGQAEYHTVARVKRVVGIPVVVNGDLDTPQKAARVLGLTGADAVMIGRAARGNPWIFRETVHLLRTGQPAARPSPEEVEETVMWHLEALYGLYGEERGVRVARKHLAWYCGGAEKAGEFLMRVCAAQSAAEQRRLAREHFGGSGAWQARGRAA